MKKTAAGIGVAVALIILAGETAKADDWLKAACGAAGAILDTAGRTVSRADRELSKSCEYYRGAKDTAGKVYNDIVKPK